MQKKQIAGHGVDERRKKVQGRWKNNLIWKFHIFLRTRCVGACVCVSNNPTGLCSCEIKIIPCVPNSQKREWEVFWGNKCDSGAGRKCHWRSGERWKVLRWFNAFFMRICVCVHINCTASRRAQIFHRYNYCGVEHVDKRAQVCPTSPDSGCIAMGDRSVMGGYILSRESTSTLSFSREFFFFL